MNPFLQATRVWRRYWGIYVMLWRNSVVREMGFKTNFLLWIVVELLWFTLQVTFIAVIYRHTDWIGDWSKWQVVFLMGTSHLIQQLFTALFLINCMQISEHIRTGRMDFFLLLPANTRFLLSLRQVDLGAFVNAASAVMVMVYAGSRLGLSPTLVQVIGFVLLCLSGLLVHYSLMFLLANASFWTVKAQGIVWGYYNLFNLARLPDVAFRGMFKMFFTFVLPMLLVSNVPSKLVLAKLSSPGDMLLLVLMSGVCLVVSEAGWRLSVRRYTSASS
ncbi:MAG TPA: ABC-2 family transporter protein [Verrucomicrobiae bacterium]|jgi:ABC-2 type transport system permease protein|nr:ABC-2 family transporter protein [Verrucomicrobiae bacterium]